MRTYVYTLWIKLYTAFYASHKLKAWAIPRNHEAPRQTQSLFLLLEAYRLLVLASVSQEDIPQRPSPIFVANPAAGHSLNPSIIDLSRDVHYDNRNPSSIKNEMISTAKAHYWRQRYETAFAEADTIRKRREQDYQNYIIALERLLKSSTKSGQERERALSVDEVPLKMGSEGRVGTSVLKTRA